MKNSFIAICLTLSLLCGCESRNEQPKPQAAPKVDTTAVEKTTAPFLSKPLNATLIESPSEALPAWRAHRDYKPTLILFSSDPMLQRVPTELTNEVKTLVNNANLAELRTKGPFSAATTILPGQTLRAALQEGFFSDVVWVLPQTDPEKYIDAELVKEQLLQSGTIDETEAETIKASEGGFTATFAGTPFRGTQEAFLPKNQGLAVLHIDLTYFRDLYQGEIKLPLYRMLHLTLTAIKETGYKGLATTIALNTLLDVIPLDKRFLGTDIVRVFREPNMLNEDPPANWKLREDALYLDNFFQPEKIRDLYLTMEKNAPGDPSVQYGLYQAAVGFKAIAPAMEYLARAVAVDPGYAKEYLDLAIDAERGTNPMRSVEFLRLAIKALPDNPLIKLRMVQNLKKGGENEQVLKLIKELLTLDWSPIYAREVPDYLRNMAQEIKESTK